MSNTYEGIWYCAPTGSSDSAISRLILNAGSSHSIPWINIFYPIFSFLMEDAMLDRVFVGFQNTLRILPRINTQISWKHKNHSLQIALKNLWWKMNSIFFLLTNFHFSIAINALVWTLSWWKTIFHSVMSWMLGKHS